MAQGKARTEQDALDYVKPLIVPMRNGMSLTDACLLTGTQKPTVISYKKKFPSVLTILNMAQTDFIAAAHKSVLKHMEKDGRLAERVLSKRRRAEWGDRIDVTSDGESISPYAKLTTEELRSLVNGSKPGDDGANKTLGAGGASE